MNTVYLIYLCPIVLQILREDALKASFLNYRDQCVPIHNWCPEGIIRRKMMKAGSVSQILHQVMRAISRIQVFHHVTLKSLSRISRNRRMSRGRIWSRTDRGLEPIGPHNGNEDDNDNTTDSNAPRWYSRWLLQTTAMLRTKLKQDGQRNDGHERSEKRGSRFGENPMALSSSPNISSPTCDAIDC